MGRYEQEDVNPGRVERRMDDEGLERSQREEPLFGREERSDEPMEGSPRENESDRREDRDDDESRDW